MTRLKNALRGHFVQPYVAGTDTPTEVWLELAKYISSISDDTQEETDDTAFYDGDGTPETSVVSVAGAYSIEGQYDSTDAAQELIADMKYKIGDGRKIYHKIVSADKTKEWVARATVTAIVAGSGDASAYETFSCNIKFDTMPTESVPTP